MDVVGAAGGVSGGFIRAVMGLGSLASSSFSSPLFFWLLTVALVATIHVASGFISSSSSRPSSEDEDTEKKVARRGGFAGDEAADVKDDGILEMMRSFSFVHASEECFVEAMATSYDGGAQKMTAPPEPAAAASSSLSFSLQYQMPEAAVVVREIAVEEKEEHEHEMKTSIPSGEHEDEAEETEEGVKEEEDHRSREVVAAAPKIVPAVHNYRFLTERDFRGFVEEPAAMTLRVQESFVPSPAPPEERIVVGESFVPSPVQPEERIVVDADSRRGGFAMENEFRPAKKKHSERDRVAAAGKRTPLLQSRKQASSPADACAVGERLSFASEFSCFGDSDSESSASDDGYSVKELAVDSDSDWFLSEQDFPAAAAHDAASLRSYKAKVLNAMEALEEMDTLERSFQDSATTMSPGSVRQASPDSIRDGSVNMEDECSVQMSGGGDDDDDELSMGSKRTAIAPAYAADSAAGNSLEHSEKETITINDHSDEATSDCNRNPETLPDEESFISFYQAAVHDTKRSPESLRTEFLSTNDHSFEVISAHSEEPTFTNDQKSISSVSDHKRSSQHSEREFIGRDDHSHELISDVCNEIVCTEKSGEVSYDGKKSSEHSDREHASTNHRSIELMFDDRKSIPHTIDHTNTVASEDNHFLEHPEQEFSADHHSHGVIIPAVDENISEPAEGNPKDLTEEEEEELESLWEHQDLIEQLKLELKKVRSAGLPTIMEESESPKAPMEDLKPWRIDAKFLREDPMDELNKFYKSYRERMRKLDILCYQKMYAIEFLQLRRPQQSTNSLKTLPPTVASILSHNFRSSRRRSPEDPSERFLKDLRYDLETVYVGQMCLSWEFLRWQYEQACDLSESDSYHSHQYNRVAGEFQQFQVMVQRFVEDESYKGPRLPNYINNRCVLRTLLQVPVVKEDSLSDRREDQRKGNYVITSEELEEVMEESMRILWEFIKADRVETATPMLKSFSSAHVELQDPLDHDLRTHIHATLQKKEKRLKDLLRTGNCIVKKFKKPKENRSNQNLFFSQVDMRLVARVLRMPRITGDQLQWCKAKLDKIILVENRKIHRESSFLLFPC